MVNFFLCVSVGECPHYEAVAIYVLSSRKQSLEAPPTLRLRELHSNLEAAFTFALESSPKRLRGCVCKSLKLPIPRRIMDLDKKDIHSRRVSIIWKKSDSHLGIRILDGHSPILNMVFSCFEQLWEPRTHIFLTLNWPKLGKTLWDLFVLTANFEFRTFQFLIRYLKSPKFQLSSEKKFGWTFA